MSPQAQPVVEYAVEGPVAVITLNRPDARNAVDQHVAHALEEAVDRLEDDPSVRVGLLLAAPCGSPERPVFCAGADLRAVREAGSASVLDTDRGGFAGFVFRERTKPVVVGVDGLAVAGGLEIVLAADVVVASARAAFGLAEVRHNLVAAAGGLYRLPLAIGQAAAMDAILTGEPITAERAYQLGLVSRLVEPAGLTDEARRVAGAIAAAGPLAVRASRRIVRDAAYLDEPSLRALSTSALAEMMASEDTAEGLRAFAEKRSPVWRSR